MIKEGSDANNGRKISLLLDFYLIAVSFGLSLYRKSGYSDLGEAKFTFFQIITLIAVFAMILFWKKIPLPKPDRIDKALIFLGISQLVSFLFSIDRRTSLWGIEGWRTGLLTNLLMTCFLIMFRHFHRNNRYTFPILIGGSVIPIGLAVLKFFGTDLFFSGNSTISTIGNINWYCGYLSLYLGLSCGLLSVKKLERWKQALLYLYYCMCLMSAFTQGSNGILLSVFSIDLILLVFSLNDQKMKTPASLLILLQGIILELLEFFWSRRIVLALTDSISLQMMEHHAGILFIAAGVLIGTVPAHSERLRKVLIRILPVLTVIVCILILVLQLMKVFPDSFGNNRGYIWKIGSTMFGEMTPLRKVIGNGQDTMHKYRLQHYAIHKLVQSLFGNAWLTNAHSWLLTVLLDTGILGCAANLYSLYVILQKFARNLFSEQNDLSAYSAAGMMSLISVLSILSVTFSHIMVTPYISVAIGIILSRIDESESEKKKPVIE